MGEIRKLTCVICPMGCSLETDIENEMVKTVRGYGCKRGISYAGTECTAPVRMLTTTVKIEGGALTLLPVKSEKPIPKGKVFDCMKVINAMNVHSPVAMGDIIIQDILETGVNIIATRNIGRV